MRREEAEGEAAQRGEEGMEENWRERRQEGGVRADKGAGIKEWGGWPQPPGCVLQGRGA